MVDANNLFCVLDDDTMTMTEGYRRWVIDTRGNGKLHFKKCERASLGVAAGTEYAFSFSVTIPASEQPAPTISVDAWLYPRGVQEGDS